MTARVGILITTEMSGDDIKKAVENWNKFNKELDKSSAAAKKQAASSKQMITNFTDLKNAVQTVWRAFQQAYAFIREGAELTLVEDRFDRLSESIGTTADALMTDLRDATRGLYSDFTLMNSAMDFMALGLAKNHEEAVRLSSVAAGLNMNMNQLVLTLTNMTTMRFDAIGVSVDGFKEKVKALEDQGYSAQDAFKEAFLQQAEGQLERVGHAADSTAGAFMQLEAALKTMAETAKTDAAEATEGLARQALTALEGWQQLGRYLKDTSAIRKIAQDMRDAQDPMGDWQQFFEEARVRYYTNTEALNAVSMATDEYTARIQHQAVVAGENVVELTDMSEHYKALIGSISDVQSEMDRYNDTNIELHEKQAQLNKDLEEAKSKYGENSDKVKDIQEDLSDLSGELEENGREHQEWARKTVFAMIQTKLAADKLTDKEGEFLLELMRKLELADDATIDMAKDMWALTEFDGDPTIDDIEAIADAAARAGGDYELDFWISTHGEMPDLQPWQRCFAKDTQITTPSGYLPIQDLQVGDYVSSFDLHRNEIVNAKVSKTFHHAPHGDYYLEINNRIKVTPNHPIYVNGAWKNAEDIVTGDALVNIQGRNVIVTKIKRINKKIHTYNIETDHPSHNYFAEGVLVHNKEEGAQQGGPVYAGQTYRVNEGMGMEMFMPGMNGRILGHAESLHAMTGGLGGNNYFYGNVTIAAGSEAGGDILEMR